MASMSSLFALAVTLVLVTGFDRWMVAAQDCRYLYTDSGPGRAFVNTSYILRVHGGKVTRSADFDSTIAQTCSGAMLAQAPVLQLQGMQSATPGATVNIDHGRVSTTWNWQDSTQLLNVPTAACTSESFAP